jgi:hypothetical protein
MTVSRRSLLAGVAGAPLARLAVHRASPRAAIAGPRAIGVSPRGDVGWIDAVTREPLAGHRRMLDGWWALAVSLDRRAVLLRRYYTEPFLIATADTRRFRQSNAFPEGVSSVKGAALAWPEAHRLMVANEATRGAPEGLTRVQVVDAITGESGAGLEIAAHVAGAAGGRRGLALAVAPGDGGAGRLALVDWAAGVRSLALAGLAFDTVRGGAEPSAGVALSPDERRVLVASASGIVLAGLDDGELRRFDAPGSPVAQLAWLDARHAVLVAQRSASAAGRIVLLDTHDGTQRTAGRSRSIVATGRSRIAFTPPEGGITTVTARGARLSHHAPEARLSMLYPQVSGRYATAVPGPVDLRAGRRLTVDLRDGALVLDKSYDHAPSDAVPTAGRY